MKQILRNIMMFCIATATFTACGDEPEVTKKDTSEKQKGQGNVTIENGAIKAAFSVGDGKKVYFSQGNLQYQASTNTWRFAENQWDFVGTHISKVEDWNRGTVEGSDNANVSETYNGWIDLFGWGTSGYNGRYPYMPSANNQDYIVGDYFDLAGTNYDWGVYNKISNGGNKAGMWRTLDGFEWACLRERRNENGDRLHTIGCVAGIRGAILLPDDWSDPYPCRDFEPGFSLDYYRHNDYTIEEWSKMEAKGAVFLPVTGFREGITVYGVDDYGAYWFSDNHGSILELSLKKSRYDFVDNGSLELHYGASVRLVQDVK